MARTNSKIETEIRLTRAAAAATESLTGRRGDGCRALPASAGPVGA